MNRLLLSAALLAAIGAAPAHATLQIAASIGPDTFFCADNTSCDTNPAVGVIDTSPTTLDGIVFSSASAAALAGTTDFLNTANLLITNTNASPVTITIAVSDTSFTPPVKNFSDADSGVWQGTSLSAETFKWFIDAANAQGAANSNDTPGVLVDNDLSTSIAPTLAFSKNGLIVDPQTTPFSLTEQTVISLGAGESLVNRGQSIIAAEATVPEPSTWVMLGIGFGFMAWGASTRRRVRSIVGGDI